MQEVTKIKTIDEIRAEMDEPPLPDGLGKIILDPTFLQNVQGQQMGEEEGGDEGGFGGGDWFGGGDKGGDEDKGDDEQQDEGDKADSDEDKGKGKNKLPDSVGDGQKEALAASESVSRLTEVLRKSYRVHGGVQTIDVEIVGE